MKCCVLFAFSSLGPLRRFGNPIPLSGLFERLAFILCSPIGKQSLAFTRTSGIYSNLTLTLVERERQTLF